MLLHACPGCGRPVPYGTPRCGACEAAREARAGERRPGCGRRPDADPRAAAFYRSREWRELSAVTMQRARFRCEDCGGVACEVHHDPPIQTPEGWAHRLDPDHLHPLCTRCHNARHGRFGARMPGGGQKSQRRVLGNGAGDYSAQKTGETIR